MPFSVDMPRGLQQFRIRMDANDALRMSCVNANCESERSGWLIVLDPMDEKHRGAARFIEQDSGRRYARFLAQQGEAEIERYGAGWGVNLAHVRDMVSRALPRCMVYVFFPGQHCFKPHLDREVIFTHQSRVRSYTHTPLGFNEHWDQEADHINRLRQRG